jgi:ACS family hexuronate transporter-like MFS transporter
MSSMIAAKSPPSVSAGSAPSWKWIVCGLLLLATMLNYMDRLTLNLTAFQIKKEMGLTNEQYGGIEFIFGIGFALGALVMGWCADRWTVRWLYPAAVLAWSAAGFATGFAQSLAMLMFFRCMLGLAEAGNWPCALRTTQHILPPGQRTMGNSILQSGAAFGAILTPQIVQVLVREDVSGSWRYPFFVVGVIGTLWVFLWLFVVRGNDLPAPKPLDKKSDERRESLLAIILQRRFLVLLIVVVCINLTWHFFRAWLPLYLRENLFYRKEAVNNFISAYYVATDIGALSAGFLTLYFVRRGSTVHGSRALVFLGGSMLTLLCLAIPLLANQVRSQGFDIVGSPEGPLFLREVQGPGWMLLGLLLLIGAGSLSLFPIYYSLSQELTVRNQGKITGTLSFSTWTATALMHPIVGRYLDSTKNLHGRADYQTVIVLAGLVPVAALLAIVCLWGKGKQTA